VRDPTTGQILLEQYKMLEERRKYFGNQFMQAIGGVTVIVTLIVGLLGGKVENRQLLKYALIFSGLAFYALAYLAIRLYQRQDDCERGIRDVESKLEQMGYTVVNMQPGSRYGARIVFVVFFALVGSVLNGAALRQFIDTGL